MSDVDRTDVGRPGAVVRALLGTLPYRARSYAYHRLVARRAARYPALFESARLAFAPSVQLGLCPTDLGHGEIAFAGFYELELTRRLAALARSGGLFVDVGANYGYFSAIWAAQRPDNRVIAYEPSPTVYQALRDNISRNGFLDRVRCVQAAASNAAGTAAFDTVAGEQTSWGGLAATSRPGTTEVRTARLDDELAPVDDRVIPALKIDTEGADAWVLSGATGLLESGRIANVFFEENRPRMAALGISRDTPATILRDRGYRVEALGPDDGDLANYHAYRT